jgi:predicted lipoprotein with Yx(FWY)xxD motif
MKRRHLPLLTVAVVALAAIGLAACGGSSNSSDSGSAAAMPVAASGDTVSTKSIGSMGNVLVDSKGKALYSNNMDSGSKIACTGQCTSFWLPLAAPSSGNPTSGDSSVEAKLGTVKRPDGTTQVTLDGKPLYTFVQDSPGQVTGNGFVDEFGGTSFTWTVATAGGSASASGGATTTTGSSSGGGGGAYGGGGY